MAYDEALAERIRELLDGERGVSEKKMFGGLAFLIKGKMAVAASSQGGILVRVDPSDAETLIAGTSATRMVMRGRPMDGWLQVPDQSLGTKRQLKKWVDLGASCARSLAQDP